MTHTVIEPGCNAYIKEKHHFFIILRCNLNFKHKGYDNDGPFSECTWKKKRKCLVWLLLGTNRDGEHNTNYSNLPITDTTVVCSCWFGHYAFFANWHKRSVTFFLKEDAFVALVIIGID